MPDNGISDKDATCISRLTRFPTCEKMIQVPGVVRTRVKKTAKRKEEKERPKRTNNAKGGRKNGLHSFLFDQSIPFWLPCETIKIKRENRI